MPLKIDMGKGALSAAIFENEALGIRRQMVFSIAIPVTIPFEGIPVATEIRLDFIRLDADGCDDLEEKTYWFPVNPANGYIDGSIYLGHVHNPVDCTRLTFGKAKGNALPVEMEFQIDFTYEGPQELGVVEAVKAVTLSFDRDELERVFAESRLPG